MARSESRDKQAEIREDRREEADDTYKGTVRGFTWFVSKLYVSCPKLTCDMQRSTPYI